MHLGFVVRPDFAFLGLALLWDSQSRLIEIKCPKVSKSKTITNCLEDLKFLMGLLADGNLSFKKSISFMAKFKWERGFEVY